MAVYGTVNYLSLAFPGMGSNPSGDIVSFCIFRFFPVPHSSTKPVQNEIKHDIHPEQ